MASRDFTLRKVAIRMVDEPPLFSDIPMNTPAAAIKVMADTFSQYDRECVAVVNLRSDLKPINMNIVSMGALDACFVHPREMMKSMVLSNASAVMMVHNHPSGNMHPSKEDVVITDKMAQICRLMDIKLLDHVIVGPGKDYFSFFEKKIMPLADLKFETDIANIELEGLRVAENTAYKTEEKKKTEATFTVAECSEFHDLGEMVQDIPTAKQALETFGKIDPERMHGIPAIGVRVAPKDDPMDFVETDIYNGKTIDLEMLSYIPEIANDWNAQRLIADLIHQCPDAEIQGEITPGIQKQLQFIESREKQADALKSVTEQLEQGVKDVFSSDKYKQFLDTMAKFPRYSVNNSILIMMQKPEAQLCQSYTGWKEMGRFVKKGEKGISILAPAPYKIEREQTKVDDKGNFVFDKDGEPVTEKVEVTIRAFKVVKTFDVSQTDGKELPTLGVNELVGSIEGYPKMLEALQQISPVPVVFEQIDGGSKGYFHQTDKYIAVQDGMSEVQTIKTLVHEMAHQQLHDKDLVAEAADITRNGKEVEAESVAYVVCQHYGINTSDYSFSYVAGWSEGKETPELKASLDKIRQTAADFITKIDEKLEVLMQDKNLVAEDITNLKGINYEYHPGDRLTEVTFECEIKGKADTLVYTVSKHDDGDAFTIDAENIDMDKYMSAAEKLKLEETLYVATQIYKWDRKIDAVKTPDEAKDLEFEFMETEIKGLSVEEQQKIHSKISEKEEFISKTEKTSSIVGKKNNDNEIKNSSQIPTERTGDKLSENKTETKETAPNPDLKATVDKVVGDLAKKRSTSKTSVKSKIKQEKEKTDQTPKKPRATKSKKEERA